MILQLSVRSVFAFQNNFKVNILKLVWKPLLAGILASSAASFIHIHWFFGALLAGVLYFGFLFMMGAIKREDISFLLKLKSQEV